MGKPEFKLDAWVAHEKALDFVYRIAAFRKTHDEEIDGKDDRQLQHAANLMNIVTDIFFEIHERKKNKQMGKCDL